MHERIRLDRERNSPRLRIFRLRNSPQIRAFAAARTPPGPWYPRDASQEGDSRLRESAHLPAFALDNLSKNPVNLSEFIEFFGNDYLHFTPSVSRPIGGPIPASGIPPAA
ncbi:MAG: hypothetical protein OXQ29_17735 [Rhodospirillaceae bacterium]|nr:hypothetical protein [Rhodospirillaceae bacterium]